MHVGVALARLRFERFFNFFIIFMLTYIIALKSKNITGIDKIDIIVDNNTDTDAKSPSLLN